MLLQFEKELSQAVEALTREQERAAQAEKDKHAEVGILILHGKDRQTDRQAD